MRIVMAVVLLVVLLLGGALFAFGWLAPEADAPPPGPGVHEVAPPPEVHATSGDVAAQRGGGASDRDPDVVPQPPRSEGPLLRGRVFGVDGAAIAGARCAWSPRFPGQPGDGASATSAPDGTFELRWPAAGQFDLRVSASGHAASTLAVRRDVAQPLAVVLQDGAELAGSVVDAARRPAALVAVEAWSLPTAARPQLALGPTRPPLGELLAKTSTDAAGRFRLVDLPIGAVLVVLGDGFAGTHVELQLAAGAVAEAALQLALPARVEGRVPGAMAGEVFACGGQALQRRVAIQPDGRFALDMLPPGRYLLGATSAPSAAQIVAVARDFAERGAAATATLVELAPGERLQLDLPQVAVTGGAVLGTAFVGGEPAAGRHLELRAGDAVTAETTVRDDGTFTFTEVPVGDCEVAFAGSEPAVRVACRVALGEVARVALAAP